MKKIFLTSTLFAALAIMGTGCLKDKGFEDHEYGINDPDDSPTGVGFPLAAKAKNTVGIEIKSTPQVISDVPVVVLFAGEPAQNDVHLKLTLNPGLVAAYNTANGTDILNMPTNLYSFQTLDVTLPAGQKKIAVPLTILNSTTLDPTEKYGIGISITSADAGYTIAENYKNLLIEINIKNKYDGVYRLRGIHNRSPYNLDPYKNKTMHLITSGPNEVFFYWPLAGDVGHPITNANNWYGNTVSPALVFDLTTNAIIDIYNYPGTAVNFDPGPATDNRYDPATKTIYAEFFYGGNPGARRFTDTLEYIGPRP